jgi:ketoreductase RED1
VIGAGTIGLSWTALFAGHTLDVSVYDPRPDLADAVRQARTEFGPHLAAQGLDVAGLTQRVHLTDDLELAVRDADVVQENGPESVKFKQEVFARIVGLAPAHALLLSSSSAIPATAFAGELADATRVLDQRRLADPVVRVEGAAVRAATSGVSAASRRSSGAGCTPRATSSG